MGRPIRGEKAIEETKQHFGRRRSRRKLGHVDRIFTKGKVKRGEIHQNADY